MFYIEKKKNSPVTAVIKCACPEAFSFVEMLLDALRWESSYSKPPDYQRAIRVISGQAEMEDGETLVIIRDAQ